MHVTSLTLMLRKKQLALLYVLFDPSLNLDLRVIDISGGKNHREDCTSSRKHFQNIHVYLHL